MGIMDDIRKNRVSRTYLWLARTVGQQEPLALTQEEIDIFHECKIMPFLDGCAQIETEYAEYGGHTLLRSVTAVRKAKELRGL